MEVLLIVAGVLFVGLLLLRERRRYRRIVRRGGYIK